MTTKTPPEPAAPPRVLDQVWCVKLQAFIPRIWVADHLAAVHGVDRRHVIQGYGGHGGRRG